MTVNKDAVSCPTCKKQGTWTPENPFKPFCSNRCKLIDLGEWAAEEHRIAGEPAEIPDQSDENENPRDHDPQDE